ncbi:MAG: type II toxin-antitoxin system RelE/ParE family toxin [Dokdonella sp.]|nr:MAG: type II toxin-antitoxin system RelE/ParE family toxin [Dokdonella sp.]
MKLRWMPEAETCLAGIESYITAETSATQARAMLKRIVERAEILRERPRSGRKVQPDNRDDLRVTHERPYWIYYRIKSDVVEILLVWHYRQRPPPS